MAKIDTKTIEGYDTMTAEEKVKALEALTIPDAVDLSRYVRKEVFDNTASELAEKKRELRAKLTDEEAAKQKEQEERQALEDKYNALLKESTIAKHKANLIAQGYDGDLAQATAEAFVSGDVETVMKNQATFIEEVKKKAKADALKDTPEPKGGQGGSTMTLKKLRSMSLSDQAAFAREHPDEYRTLYTKGE